MSTLSLESILANMADDGAVTSKTAADSTNTEASMLEVVRSLTENTKTAAAAQSGDAVAALQKIAADNAAAEDHALVKQAELLGASMCDGFMSRLAGYDAAVATKTAGLADALSANRNAIAGSAAGGLGGAGLGALAGGEDHRLEGALAGGLAGAGLGGAAGHYAPGAIEAAKARLAGIPDAVAEGVQSEISKGASYTADQLKLAYAQGAADFQKQAAAEYAQGQEDALQEIHKIASDVHFAGQQSAANVMAALASAGNS